MHLLGNLLVLGLIIMAALAIAQFVIYAGVGIIAGIGAGIVYIFKKLGLNKMKRSEYIIVASAIVIALALTFHHFNQRKTPHPQPAQAVSSSTKTPSVPAFSTDEFLIQLNNLRIQHGLSPLIRTSALDQTAQAHAEDMKTRQYYNHTTPDGITSYQRIRAVLGNNVYAGENEDDICPDSTVITEFNRFSTSPEHQQNQLDIHYTRVGLGYIKNDPNRCNGFFVLDFAS